MKIDTWNTCKSCLEGKHSDCANRRTLARVCYCDTCAQITADVEQDKLDHLADLERDADADRREE